VKAHFVLSFSDVGDGFHPPENPAFRGEIKDKLSDDLKRKSRSANEKAAI